MKPEFNVKVFSKGCEYSLNKGPVQKAEMFPPLVDAWIPLQESYGVEFKRGRQRWILYIERVHKAKKNGRS